MARFARQQRVFFIEEPLLEPGIKAPDWKQYATPEGVIVSIPRLPADFARSREREIRRALIDELFANEWMQPDVFWFYTPAPLSWMRHLNAKVVVYDSPDEVGTRVAAPSDFRRLDDELLERAELVFAGGRSSYEAKRFQHPAVHEFPNSVDVEHFLQARGAPAEPGDQAHIDRPRLGFYGVIDERLDIELLDSLAEQRPDFQIVMVGPVNELNPACLPRRRNLHWLGPKRYDELPSYIGGWDVALMPFAVNAATHFISPHKTLEYLAAGRRIVSTPIRDVVEPYGRLDLVRIADRDRFTNEVTLALSDEASGRCSAADALLATTSWDRTWDAMVSLINARLESESSVADDDRQPRSTAG